MTDEKKRGFALLTPERRKELGARGGRAAKTRYRFTPEKAREAGRIGGLNRGKGKKNDAGN